MELRARVAVEYSQLVAREVIRSNVEGIPVVDLIFTGSIVWQSRASVGQLGKRKRNILQKRGRHRGDQGRIDDIQLPVILQLWA